jgi:hypothetical protein
LAAKDEIKPRENCAHTRLRIETVRNKKGKNSESRVDIRGVIPQKEFIVD